MLRASRGGVTPLIFFIDPLYVNMHYCYILYNGRNAKTYNGYTTDPHRRLRQHNSEICGGARATTCDSKREGPGFWRFLAVIECKHDDWTKNRALSLEWHIRYPKARRGPRGSEFHGPLGRIRGLPLVFSHAKFNAFHFKVFICEEHFDAGKNILDGCENVEVGSLPFSVSLLDVPEERKPKSRKKCSINVCLIKEDTDLEESENIFTNPKIRPGVAPWG